jgi:hypothetical protein
LHLLSRHGLERHPNKTARDFVDDLAAALPLECSTALRRLTEDYLAHRFGNAPNRDGARALDALRTGLRAVRRSPRGSATPRQSA